MAKNSPCLPLYPRIIPAHFTLVNLEKLFMEVENSNVPSQLSHNQLIMLTNLVTPSQLSLSDLLQMPAPVCKQQLQVQEELLDQWVQAFSNDLGFAMLPTFELPILVMPPTPPRHINPQVFQDNYWMSQFRKAFSAKLESSESLQDLDVKQTLDCVTWTWEEARQYAMEDENGRYLCDFCEKEFCKGQGLLRHWEQTCRFVTIIRAKAKRIYKKRKREVMIVEEQVSEEIQDKVVVENQLQVEKDILKELFEESSQDDGIEADMLVPELDLFSDSLVWSGKIEDKVPEAEVEDADWLLHW